MVDQAGPGSGSQTVTLVSRKKNNNKPVSRRSSVALGFLCVNDRESRHRTVQKNNPNSRGAVDTSTLAVSCALAGKSQLPLKARPPVLSPARSKETKNHSFVHVNPCCRTVLKKKLIERGRDLAHVHHRHLQSSASSLSRRS